MANASVSFTGISHETPKLEIDWGFWGFPLSIVVRENHAAIIEVQTLNVPGAVEGGPERRYPLGNPHEWQKQPGSAFVLLVDPEGSGNQIPQW